MGHHNIQFVGDPFSNHGVWSPPTSRANFCEEDYNITFYLAEFINALTNVTYVYLALRAMYRPSSRDPGRSNLLRPSWDFMSASLFVLGVGSFLFHATLRQTLEFVDEFSMLGLTWSMLHASLTARQSPRRARVISVGLAVAYLSFAVFYLWAPKIIYQVYAFSTSLAVLLLRTFYVFHWAETGFPEEKRRDWVRRTWKAVATSLLGYMLWIIDFEHCAQLRAWRESLGLPWAFLLELHGWWHILTAIGASQSMQVAREARAEVEREKAQ
ncbi:hypothetical protein VTJ49DRAFT_1645 [Mycothermus thermophilus]|uniref:Alkaline ceramidase family protein n=1 Tax=Humicola insolens TaxID=85995 RepID=A0ABR3VC90_HUMIN